MPFKNTEGIVSMFNLGSSTETYDDLYFVSLNSLEASLAPMTDISSTGSVMYSSHAIWFVVVSLILLIAMVGSIAVTTNTADSGSSK